MKFFKKGQSLIEVVVSIGLVVLVTSGVVMLLVNVLGGRSRSFDRRKATELAQKVIETIVADKNQDSDRFWRTDQSYWTTEFSDNMVDSNFEGYFYDVTNQQILTGSCNGEYACVEVTVTVGWDGSSDTVSVNRLFTKY